MIFWEQLLFYPTISSLLLISGTFSQSTRVPLTIYVGMKNVTDKRFKIASYFGLAGCALLYGLAGFMGYCMYGRAVKSNFLLSLDIHEMNAAIYYILKFCYLISVFIAYPILIFGARSHSRSIYKTFKTLYHEKMRKK